MKIYKSKIDSLLAIPITLVIVTLAVVMIRENSWIGLLIILLVFALLLHIFLTTQYWVDGNFLKIRSGFIVNTAIEIKHISKVLKSSGFLSSPATSFSRIEIHYNKFDSVSISPADRSGLVEELKKINPRIEVRLD